MQYSAVLSDKENYNIQLPKKCVIKNKDSVVFVYLLVTLPAYFSLCVTICLFVCLFACLYRTVAVKLNEI